MSELEKGKRNVNEGKMHTDHLPGMISMCVCMCMDLQVYTHLRGNIQFALLRARVRKCPEGAKLKLI